MDGVFQSISHRALPIVPLSAPFICLGRRRCEPGHLPHLPWERRDGPELRRDTSRRPQIAVWHFGRGENDLLWHFKAEVSGKGSALMSERSVSATAADVRRRTELTLPVQSQLLKIKRHFWFWSICLLSTSAAKRFSDRPFWQFYFGEKATSSSFVFVVWRNFSF